MSPSSLPPFRLPGTAACASSLQGMAHVLSAHRLFAEMPESLQGSKARHGVVSAHRTVYWKEGAPKDDANQVFDAYGVVLKLSCVGKLGYCQVLVQDNTCESAVQAMEALQGRYIYDGCCQLDIKGAEQILHVMQLATRNGDPGGSWFACLVLNSKLAAGHTTSYSMHNLLTDSIVWEDSKSMVLSIELYVQWDPGIMKILPMHAVVRERPHSVLGLEPCANISTDNHSLDGIIFCQASGQRIIFCLPRMRDMSESLLFQPFIGVIQTEQVAEIQHRKCREESKILEDIKVKLRMLPEETTKSWHAFLANSSMIKGTRAAIRCFICPYQVVYGNEVTWYSEAIACLMQLEAVQLCENIGKTSAYTMDGVLGTDVWLLFFWQWKILMRIISSKRGPTNDDAGSSRYAQPRLGVKPRFKGARV